MASLGHVTVELMVRLGDAEPQSLGFVQLPLTIKTVATSTVEGSLSDAVGFVRADLLRVFGKDVDS